MLNPIECYCTNKFQYILIHKNGCSMMANTIVNNYEYQLNKFVYNDRPSFAILRDPWERTISGLSYDLERTFGDVTEDILDSIDLKRLFYQPIHYSQQKTAGFISHVSVQIGYMFDITPTFYLMLNDLSAFLKIHFSEQNIATDKKNQSSIEFKNKLLTILDKRLDIVDTIKKYIEIDYYFIDRIKNTELLWDFSMGKMWNE